MPPMRSDVSPMPASGCVGAGAGGIAARAAAASYELIATGHSGVEAVHRDRCSGGVP